MKHFVIGFLVGAAIVFLMLYADACQRRERAARRRRQTVIYDDPIAKRFQKHKRNPNSKFSSVDDIDAMFKDADS